MKMMAMPMTVTDWDQAEVSRHEGDTGFALWRTRNFGDIRVRTVEYSPGYSADHWCSKGHVILCLSGSMKIELQNGQRLELCAGQSYHVGDGDPPHRSTSEGGVKLFIVD
jgi:hypothetical protein